MSDDDLQNLNFESGDIIFEKGDAALCAYLIHDGEVDVFLEKDGVIEIIDTLEPGEIFGEMALVDDKPHSAGAMAKGSTTCIMVSKSVLEHQIKATTPLMQAMVKLFVKRLRRSASEREAKIH